MQTDETMYSVYSLLNSGMRILDRGATPHILLGFLCQLSSIHPSIHLLNHCHFILSLQNGGLPSIHVQLHTHTVTQSHFIIEKLHQGLGGSVAARRSEAKNSSDLLTWSVGIASVWCLLSVPKPCRVTVYHSGEAARWKASSPSTSNASVDALSQP